MDEKTFMILEFCEYPLQEEERDETFMVLGLYEIPIRGKDAKRKERKQKTSVSLTCKHLFEPSYAFVFSKTGKKKEKSRGRKRERDACMQHCPH